jgi:hypothetical protein
MDEEQSINIMKRFFGEMYDIEIYKLYLDKNNRDTVEAIWHIIKDTNNNILNEKAPRHAYIELYTKSDIIIL